MFFNKQKLIDQYQQQLHDVRSQYEVELAELRELVAEKDTALLRVQQEKETVSAILAASLSGSTFLDRVRNDLAANATKLESEQQQLSVVDELLSQSAGAVGRLNEHAHALQKQAQSSSGAVSVLEDSTRSIQQLLSSIKEISDQTNLLALNAAIEAARAGEHGRGFAVVADEVRQLAKKAHDASDQIDELVTTVVSQTQNIAELIEESNNGSVNVSASASQISSVVSQMTTQTQRMQHVINRAATNMFLQTVKMDHAVWKSNVYNIVECGRSGESVVDHHNCRLGKWYFKGAGAEKYKHLHSFKRLDTPHQHVHTAGAQAASLLGSGNLKAVLEQLKNMEDASIQVVDALDALQGEIDREKG